MTSTILQAGFEVAGQPPELGALPTLMAATADLPGSTYIGPSGPLQMKGHPRIVSPRRLAHGPGGPGAACGRSAKRQPACGSSNE